MDDDDNDEDFLKFNIPSCEDINLVIYKVLLFEKDVIIFVFILGTYNNKS